MYSSIQLIKIHSIYDSIYLLLGFLADFIIMAHFVMSFIIHSSHYIIIVIGIDFHCCLIIIIGAKAIIGTLVNHPIWASPPRYIFAYIFANTRTSTLKKLFSVCGDPYESGQTPL